MREFFANLGLVIALVTIPVHVALFGTVMVRSRDLWIEQRGPLGERMKKANLLFTGRNARLLNWALLNIQVMMVGLLTYGVLSR